MDLSIGVVHDCLIFLFWNQRWCGPVRIFIGLRIFSPGVINDVPVFTRYMLYAWMDEGDRTPFQSVYLFQREEVNKFQNQNS